MKYVESMLRQPAIWFLLGVGIAVTLGMTVFASPSHNHNDTHPIGYADLAKEVHVHSDWALYIAGTTYDLSGDAFMTTSDHTLHPDIHLHDHNDHVIHRHDHGVTIGAFLDSLGFTFENDCIVTPQANAYCNTDDEQLLVFVNGVAIEDPVDYVSQEEDKILIYYGSPTSSDTIAALQADITDEACYYSSTCPERGTPPPESCGLTCEL